MTDRELMRTRRLLAFIVLALAGCTSGADGSMHIGKNKDDTPQINQCLRTQLFQQCMKLLPVGPQATKYNDWDEVVSQCSRTATAQSIRAYKHIPQECRYD